MAILKNKLKQQFTQIPNELIVDNRLSMGAKLIYVYLASKPDGWQVWNGDIQKALNIKDSGTMSKYWKELLNAGWVTRTPIKSEDGRFSGGYDYEIGENPNTEKTPIRKISASGENPDYNNTNLDNNTNTNINTNIYNSSQENFTEEKGKLFSTETKIKKKGENQFISVIEQCSQNTTVRDALLEYYKFRCKKGLTIEQWKVIVEDFKNNSTGKTVTNVIDAIRECIKFGNMTLFYRTYDNKPQSFSTPVENNSSEDGFDNLSLEKFLNGCNRNEK